MKTMIPMALAKKRAGKTKADVVVAVRRFVPVAVRGAEVLWIVVPGTTAQNSGRGRSGPGRDAVTGLATVTQYRNARGPEVEV